MTIAGAWTFGWDALVAIGTLALAVVTVAVGIIAVRANRVARRGVEIAAEDLKASMTPLLEPTATTSGAERRQLRAGGEYAPKDVFTYEDVGGPPEERTPLAHEVDVFSAAGAVYVSIPIRNVGHGIAKISARERPRALSVPDREWTDGTTTRGLVPPDMGARLNFRLAGVRYEIYAEVVYTDITGDQETRLRLYIKLTEDGSGKAMYEFRGTALYEGTGNIPSFLRTVTGDRQVLEPQPAGTSAHA